MVRRSPTSKPLPMPPRLCRCWRFPRLPATARWAKKRGLLCPRLLSSRACLANPRWRSPSPGCDVPASDRPARFPATPDRSGLPPPFCDTLARPPTSCPVGGSGLTRNRQPAGAHRRARLVPRRLVVASAATFQVTPAEATLCPASESKATPMGTPLAPSDSMPSPTLLAPPVSARRVRPTQRKRPSRPKLLAGRPSCSR